MEEKNGKYNKKEDLSEENLEYLSKNDVVGKDELRSINKKQENLLIKEKMENEANSKINEEIDNKEGLKKEFKEELKLKENNSNDEIGNKEDSKKEFKEELKLKEKNSNDEIGNKENSTKEFKEELKLKVNNSKDEIGNKENSTKEFKEELRLKVENKIIDNKSPEKSINNSSETKQISIEKSNQINKDGLDLKPKVKPKKEIPIEKKPFNEFINEHLIPEIINEFKSRDKVINEIYIKKTNRPISEDICWVIYCEVRETCNFWLSFEKDDITSLKSFSLCKNYEKPSIIESFLIDEKKITLKLIISRILQRLNGQKLIGAN